MVLFRVLIIYCSLHIANQINSLKFTNNENTRNYILEVENKLTTGAKIRLNIKELKVNEIFIKYKQEELLRGFRNDNLNAPSMHFFKAKELIEKSKVFKFLRYMPKGATLHLHTSASVSSKWMVQNISYTPGLLRCTTKNGLSILTFRRSPSLHGCISKYVSVKEERLTSGSAITYDQNMEKLFNLWTPVPEIKYPTIKKVWTTFQNMFQTLNDVLRYLPVFRSYLYRMLQELYDDNIMYAELRMNFNEFYDKNGSILSTEDTVQVVLKVLDTFKLDHPYFLGFKVIYSTFRGNEQNILNNIKIFEKLHTKYPDFLVGFDLVGQEDNGKSLLNLREILAKFSSPVQFFLHAGETNYYGATTDNNLLDAILLNTTRIGHGYALMKHPVLYDAVKKRNIAIEVSPISNQVLHLVSDLRNHPASLFIANNIPFVICNDDPGFWNANALSYDFYYAIMSLAPNYAGLKMLKNLVWNSIQYATLRDSEKKTALFKLQRNWDNFIDDILNGYIIEEEEK